MSKNSFTGCNNITKGLEDPENTIPVQGVYQHSSQLQEATQSFIVTHCGITQTH